MFNLQTVLLGTVLIKIVFILLKIMRNLYRAIQCYQLLSIQSLMHTQTR